MSKIDKPLAQQCAEAMWANDDACKELSMSILSIEEGHAEISMPVTERMLNGWAICHGGYIFTLADSAFAYACNSQNQMAVAASCAIDFIRPARLGDVLTASATVVNQGKRNGLYDATVVNQSGEVIAQFRGRSARTKGQIVTNPLESQES